MLNLKDGVLRIGGKEMKDLGVEMVGEAKNYSQVQTTSEKLKTRS